MKYVIFQCMVINILSKCSVTLKSIFDELKKSILNITKYNFEILEYLFIV